MNPNNPFSLEGKTILVTGASSGIGKATAVECSKMGAKLIISGRNTERLQKTYSQLEGNGHIIKAADVTSCENLEDLIGSIEGKINGAVLCAGIVKNYPIQFCSRDKFSTMLEVNFYSQTELIRLLLKKKKLYPGASVVAISSIASYNPSIGNAIYGAGKAALTSFIKYCANEYLNKGLRFNCISPAMVETPLIEGGAFSDEQIAEDKAHYIGNRYGQAEEVAWGAIYLLSDATTWVTGTNLIIDGGLTM